MKKILLAVGIIGSIGLVIGAWRWAASPDSRPVASQVRVVTSFYPLEFLVARIGGDAVAVSSVVPPGAEPHDYELTARDIASMQDADVVFLHGTLEPWADKIKETIASEGARPVIVHVSDGLMTRAGSDEHGSESHDDGEHLGQHEAGKDPHIWLDPASMRIMADRVSEQLMAIDVPHAREYQARTDVLKKELDALHQQYADGLATCQRRDFITTHDAFGYLADAYRLRQVPLAGLSPDAEPSPQDMASVVSFARVNNVTHIFFETLVSPKLAETVARSVGAKTMVLNPLEGLTTEDVASGKTYLTVMRDNLNNLRAALNCQ